LELKAMGNMNEQARVTLQEELQQQKDKFDETAPDETKITYKKGIDEVVESG
tara:strand:- start:10803 stop:10958 length:156 start_codon:yes stop_codon:yes gene_type:complete